MPSLLENLLHRLDDARNARRFWEGHWQDIADYVLPNRAFTSHYIPGSQLRRRQYNTTAPDANESLAAALSGMLVNPAVRWFETALEDESGQSADMEDAVAVWLFDTTSRMLAYLNRSDCNMATAFNEVFLDECAFGTGVVSASETNDRFRLNARALGCYWLVTNSDGEVTETFREFEATATELVAMFDEDTDTLPETITRAASSSDASEAFKKFTVYHCVSLRKERDITRADKLNKPWASYYFTETPRHLIRQSGLDSSPHLTPRWTKSAEETYGRSPSMRVLPTILALNKMDKDAMIAGELANRPPINAVAMGMDGGVRTAPGAINYVKSMAMAPKAMEMGVNPLVGSTFIENREARVERAYFLDILKLPERDRMTATEILERRQQGLILAAPMLGRQYSELLKPMLMRLYRFMKQRRMFLPMPEGLEGRRLKIDFVGPMARSQRASETQGFVMAMQSAQLLMQINPNVVENLDTDESFRSLMALNNVNPLWLRSRRFVREIRAQQAQMAQLQAQISLGETAAAAGRDAAAAAKDLGFAQAA